MTQKDRAVCELSELHEFILEACIWNLIFGRLEIIWILGIGIWNFKLEVGFIFKCKLQ